MQISNIVLPHSCNFVENLTFNKIFKTMKDNSQKKIIIFRNQKLYNIYDKEALLHYGGRGRDLECV